MSAKIGTISVGGMYLGADEINRAYLGETLVYQKFRPYLEIDPELIWVNPDWAVDNDVYSNTNWNVQ